MNSVGRVIRENFKRFLFGTGKTVLKPVLAWIERQDIRIMTLQDAAFRTRAMQKCFQGTPVTVLFICHEPAVWSMFGTVYEFMAEDPFFSPLVITLPYTHMTLEKGRFKDGGMSQFCKNRGIRYTSGYDPNTNKWLDPASFMPDYVFFQTPYSLLAQAWSVEQVSMMAKICYIPYGSLLETGDIAAVSHPEGFFRHVHKFYLESGLNQELFIAKFTERRWFNEKKFVLSGHPKIDYLAKNSGFRGRVWKRRKQKNIRRILWTPRWNTWEGTCHFFDYRDYFHEFCKNNPHVDFVFRPHPLCLQNFANTGELPMDRQMRMRSEYAASVNMAFDENPDYEDTFMTSDILVSDLSSMMLEYLATGKPIVYTHRRNLFNGYGLRLAEGLYWVKNHRELDQTLQMLLSGQDPLAEKRRGLMKTLYFVPEGGAGRFIAEDLKSDYKNLGSSLCGAHPQVFQQQYNI